MRRFSTRFTALALAAALCVWAKPAAAQTPYAALGDTWIEQVAPLSTHGFDAELISKNTPGDHMRPMVMFDLSSIPFGSTVVKAELEFFVTSPDLSGLPINIHRNQTPWSEATATWFNNWAPFDSITVHGSLDPSVLGWTSADIAALVQDWVDGVYPNFGLVLLSTSANVEARIASRESTMQTIRPTLTVTLAAPSGDISVRTGSYVGDGTVDRAISGVGFDAEFVLIKGGNGLSPVIRTSSMNGDDSKELDGNNPNAPDMITSIDPDGFTVGTRDEVNEPGETFYWTAVTGDLSVLDVGAYIGIGVDNAVINWLNFQPAYAIIMAEDGEVAMQRFVDQVPDDSFAFFPDDARPNRIQYFYNGAIEIGDHPSVNANGQRYNYIAWAASAGTAGSGIYFGDGSDDRSISGLGFSPDAVLVRADGPGEPTMLRTDAVSGDSSFPLDDGFPLPNAIQGFEPDGFEVGTDPSVNEFGPDYFWAALHDPNPPPLQADLVTTMTVDDASPNEGDAVTYYVTVRNLGPNDASAVIVAEALPAGVTHVSHIASQGVFDPAFELWGVGALAAGDSATLDIAVTVDGGTSGQTIINTAGAYHGGAESDPDVSNDKAFAQIVVNRAPAVVDAIADTSFVEDSPAISYRDLNDVFLDVDDGTALGFQISSNSNPALVAASIDAADSTLDLSFGAELSGSSTLVVRATDSGGLWAEDTFVVTVTAVNDTPIVAAAIVDTTIAEDDTVTAFRSLRSVFSDVEDGSDLSFVVQANSNPGLLTASIDPADSTLDLTTAPNMVGAAFITLRATDSGGLFTDEQFIVTVAPVNDVPVIVSPMPDTLVAESAPPIAAYRDLNNVFDDVEDGNALTFDVYHNGNPSLVTATINPADSVLDLSIAPSQTGSALLIIGATDSGGESTWDTLTVFVDPPAALVHRPGSLYPAETFIGDDDLTIRVAIDNATPIGVALDTTTTVSFSDGARTYQALLENPTYVPPSATNFTLTFAAQAVPDSMTAPANYDLRLDLAGIDDGAFAFNSTLWTTGGDSLFVDTPKMRLLAQALDVSDVRPGASGSVLTFDVSNEYSDTRALDSITVTNFSNGPGSQAELDAEILALNLYVDADADGAVSPADTLLATSNFSAGSATFAVGGWNVASGSMRRMLVAAQADSNLASDSDALDVVVSSPLDVQFSPPSVVADNFSALYPLDSFGRLIVDGMVRHQIDAVPAAMDTLLSGTSDNLVLTLLLPQNGYRPDTLSALSISNSAVDFDPADFAALRLHDDNGDGLFDPLDDPVLGTFVYSGDRYQVSGIDHDVVASHLFFVAADIASDATDGNHFAAVIPVDGVEMTSGNDGPIDGNLVVGGSVTIRRDQRINIAPLALPAQSPRPGGEDVGLLLLRIENNAATTVTLDTLSLDNVTVGAGTLAQLDATLAQLTLYMDDGDGLVGPLDTPLSAGLTFSGGQLTASDLALDIPSGAARDLLVAASIDSTCARDGDSLSVSVPASSGLGFVQSIPVVGSFPLATTDSRVVDGMVAHQLTVSARTDSLVVSAGTEVLVFDFGLPANGYEADTLSALELQNLGTATAEHISRLQLFADGGDGLFDAGAGDDIVLGDFSEVLPQRYRIENLAHLLSAACGAHSRFFAAADIRSDYSVGGSIQFAVAMNGVEMASNNDGPTDAHVADPSTLVIPKPDRLTIFPYSVGEQIVMPGSKRVLNFGIGFYNGYTFSVQLDELKLFQSGTASSAEIDSVFAYADVDTNGLFDPQADSLLVALPSAGASYTFNVAGWDLPAQKVSYVFVAYDLPLAVTDSMSIDLTMFDEAGITVSPIGTNIEGEFPINSPGVDVTDGMIAAQVATGSAPAFRAAPGDNDVLALDVTLPGNGIWPDQLDYVSVANLGSAAATTDIADVRLWREGGGDPGAFDAADDTPVSVLGWDGNHWTNMVALNEPVPVAGARFYVTFSVAAAPTDGATVRMAVPIDGVSMASANDGPIDAAAVNDHEQVISTDPLITALLLDRASYSVGQTINVTMTLRNEGPDSLLSIAPAVLSVSGAATVALDTGPFPLQLDLAPGQDSTFVWQYSAAGAGELSLCGNAATADTSAVSQTTCSAAANIENRALGVSLTLSNFAPPSANRGQNNVPLAQITLAYDDFDSLAAVVNVSQILVSIEDDLSAPLAPDAVLDRVSLIAANGINESFAVGAANPLVMQPQTPVYIEAGDSLILDFMCDIADSAAFVAFQASLAVLADIAVVDANDGLPVPVVTGESFPWRTTPVVVNERAKAVLVSAPAPSSLSTNTGQDDVTALSMTLRNTGGVNTADEILTDVTLAFFDTAGAPLAPGGVIRRLSLVSGGQVLHVVDDVPLAGNVVAANLNTPLVITPGSPADIDVIIDTRVVPQVENFVFSIEDETALVARDINSGQLITVAADVGTSFPIHSNTIAFETPATSLLVDYNDRLPSAVLPLTADVPVMDVTFTHPDSAAAAVLIDSLAFEFIDSDDNPVFPGDYFSRLYVVNGIDTVAVNTTLSGVLPFAGVNLPSPLAVTAGGSEQIAVVLDAKDFFAPVDLRIRLDQTSVIAIDANAGSRLFGLSGPFPFVAGPASLQIPASLVQCTMDSQLPSNVAAAAVSLGAFDLLVENSNPAGHTPAQLTRLRVAVEDAKGNAMPPDGILTAATLNVGGTEVASGQLGPSEILFDVNPGDLVIASATSATITINVSVNGGAAGRTFRFLVRDAASTEMVDAVTGAPIPVTVADGQYPLQTNLTTVLGSNVDDGFTNYPNPFAAGREVTRITYFVDQPSTVSLDLYTIWGAHVATLFEDKSVQTGLHQDIAWDGRNGEGNVVNNGVYYLVLRVKGADGHVTTVKRKAGVVR